MVVITIEGVTRTGESREMIVLDTHHPDRIKSANIRMVTRRYRNRIENVFGAKSCRSTQDILRGFERGAVQSITAPLSVTPVTPSPSPRFEELRSWTPSVRNDEETPRHEEDDDDDDDIDLSVSTPRIIVPKEFDPVQDNIDLVRKLEAQGYDGEAMVRKMFSREPTAAGDISDAPIVRPQTAEVSEKKRHFSSIESFSDFLEDRDELYVDDAIDDEGAFEDFLMRRNNPGMSDLMKFDEEGEAFFEQSDSLFNFGDKPTRAKPGSDEKCAVLEWRYANGLPLHHPRDRWDHAPDIVDFRQ